MPADDVLDTLMLPLADGRLDASGGATLFLRARDGTALREQVAAGALPGLVCEQSFKPEADALQRAGFTCRVADDGEAGTFDLVLVLPPRQRDEARALLARAVRSARAGGRVLACVANAEGARSSEADLARLTGAVGSASKNKCRVFWSAPLGAGVDTALVDAWCALDAPRAVADGRFVSRPGLFAWDRIDPATALLAAHLPTDLRGRAADLGAGHGVLAALTLQRCPRITGIDLYEAEARALDLARRNLAAEEDRVAIGYHWHDVTNGLPRSYENIVSNPPFHHVGRAALPEVGQRFIAVAASALRPAGSLWLVANRQLPYEAALAERFGAVEPIAEAEGYKVIRAIKTIRRHADGLAAAVATARPKGRGGRR